MSEILSFKVARAIAPSQKERSFIKHAKQILIFSNQLFHKTRILK